MVKEQTRSADPLVGQEIDEYRVESVLGRGGMGVVYKAEDTNLGITVALKMIDPALARDASFVRRFRAEARAMARISSPHIVRVMAMRQTEHGLFIVMEYVDGGTLHDRMQRGPMPWSEAWPIVRQILQALEKAHSVGVVHRDIKPRNIMLTRDGTVKVTDFGLAKLVSDDPAVTVTQAVAGTLLYMSPEQIRASAALDARSDLFSLGLVVYEMLAGRLPFDRDAGEFAVMRAIVEESFPPPTKHAASIPAPVARVVMKALEKDANRRYADAGAMCAALEQLAPAAKPDPVPERSGTEWLRRPLAWGIAAMAVVLLSAGGILYFVVAPAAPGQVTAAEATAAGATSISLSWNAAREAEAYIVERSADGSDEWLLVQDGLRATTFTDTGLATGTTYRYRIRAWNAAGAGPPSRTLRAITTDEPGLSAPGPVTGLRSTRQTRGAISLAWEAIPEAEAYTLERSPDGSTNWTARADAHAETTFQDAGLASGTTYWYRVRATNAAGDGPYTEPLAATTAAAGPEAVASGVLAVTAASGATYTVAGRRIDGPHSLPAGQHTVQCEAAGFTAETRVAVRANETSSVTCHVERTINVNTTADGGAAPWATVLVNGRHEGQTPRRLTLGPGRHTIAVQRDGFEVLTPAAVVEVRPTFAQPEPVRLSFRVRPLS